jgi:hypothetical protein
VLVSVDDCPLLPAATKDGCPIADRDGDKIPDHEDKCPDEAEDFDGLADGDGCPETDADSDGVLDELDKCPLLAEDINGYQDDDGCPDADRDHDDILAEADKCPDQPETVNRYLDQDGCPDTAPVLTIAASFSEPVTGTDLKRFASTLGLVYNPGTGELSGVLSGVGEADVTFTCYNTSDPSEIYDKATAHYIVTYRAPVTGKSAGDFNGPRSFRLKIAPAVTLKRTVTHFYTDEHCTHLNAGSPDSVEHDQGSGELGVSVDPVVFASIITKWSSTAGNVTGGWVGWAELSPAS